MLTRLSSAKAGIALLGAGLTLALMPAPLAAEEAGQVATSVIEHSDSSRTLVHEAVIDAPIERVWTAFTTEDGWKMWGPKFARVDLRQGGTIEASYSAEATSGDPANIVHRILAMSPMRMIALRIEQVPAGGPVDIETAQRFWSVYELEPIGDAQTRLRINGIGYGADEQSLRLLEFFKSGNAYSIDLLRKNLAQQAQQAQQAQ